LIENTHQLGVIILYFIVFELAVCTAHPIHQERQTDGRAEKQVGKCEFWSVKTAI